MEIARQQFFALLAATWNIPLVIFVFATISPFKARPKTPEIRTEIRAIHHDRDSRDLRQEVPALLVVRT